MKVCVTKLKAARNQLEEAIRLFFEERDEVSIHTLVCAALQILNDHISEDEACKNNLILHYDTIYIKDEYRNLWQNHLWKARNFFKHADRDIRKGNIFIEFETELNAMNIFECIRCLVIVEKDTYIRSPELEAFRCWYILNKPDIFKKSFILEMEKRFNLSELSHSRKEWNNILYELKKRKKCE